MVCVPSTILHGREFQCDITHWEKIPIWYNPYREFAGKLVHYYIIIIITFTSSALKCIHKRQSLYEVFTFSQGNLEQLIWWNQWYTENLLQGWTGTVSHPAGANPELLETRTQTFFKVNLHLYMYMIYEWCTCTILIYKVYENTYMVWSGTEYISDHYYNGTTYELFTDNVQSELFTRVNHDHHVNVFSIRT